MYTTTGSAGGNNGVKISSTTGSSQFQTIITSYISGVYTREFTNPDCAFMYPNCL
jgi:hypothetical protein